MVFKVEYFLPKTGNKVRMSTLAPSNQHCARDASQCNKRRNRNKSIWTEKKEIKLSLFTSDMIIYMKRSIEPTKKKKATRTIEFSKFAE